MLLAKDYTCKIQWSTATLELSSEGAQLLLGLPRQLEIAPRTGIVRSRLFCFSEFVRRVRGFCLCFKTSADTARLH